LCLFYISHVIFSIKGTGKSLIIEVIVYYIRKEYSQGNDDIVVVVLAPTGLAAYNVNGSTIHRFLKKQSNTVLIQIILNIR
jgi:hypothetical protein